MWAITLLSHVYIHGPDDPLPNPVLPPRQIGCKFRGRIPFTGSMLTVYTYNICNNFDTAELESQQNFELISSQIIRQTIQQTGQQTEIQALFFHVLSSDAYHLDYTTTMKKTWLDIL